MSTLWSKSDVEKLKQFVLEGKSKEFLAEYFNRTEVAIEVKVNRLGLQLIRKNRNWLSSDLESFKNDWIDATVSVPMMIKKYKRSWYSLRKKALLLELGARPYDDEYVTILDTCNEMNVSRDRVYNWIDLGLKFKKGRSGRVKYLISQEDLLLFLETHKEYFNASIVSEFLFYDEPTWFKQKRRDDRVSYKLNARNEYTNDEDLRIISLFKRGRSNSEIATILNRSDSAIALRLQLLGYFRGKYNDYEIDILRKNSRYLTVDELLQLLPLRTKKGITYKCKELGLPYHLSDRKSVV